MKPFHFKHFSITQTNSALKVGTDAMLLGAHVNAKNPSRILDIGTGNGVIALMLAQRCPNATILGIDNDSISLIDCKQNFESSDWFDRLRSQEIAIFDFNPPSQFDLIVSNPPFYETNLRNINEREANAKHGSSDFLYHLMLKSFELLNDAGEFWMIYPTFPRPNKTKDPIEIYSTSIGYSIKNKINLFSKPGIQKRAIYCFSKQKEGSMIEESILIRTEDNNYSEAYKKLTADFHAETTWTK